MNPLEAWDELIFWIHSIQRPQLLEQEHARGQLAILTRTVSIVTFRTYFFRLILSFIARRAFFTAPAAYGALG